jgi:hypothetical protein
VNAVDSSVNRDGSEFRGELVSPIVSGNDVVVHPESEVRGLLVLLRSRTHPEGFRYELLITQITDKGKSFDVTASLNASLADIDNNRPPSAEPELLKSHESTAPPAEKLPAASH